MKIDIKGTIIRDGDKWIYDFFDMPSTCPRDVLAALGQAKGEEIDVFINSPGGNVFAGSEIYSALRSAQGMVKIHVVGLAASAASVIMCAGHCDISPTAMVMIHNASAYLEGDYDYIDMQQNADALNAASRALCSAYVEKTGRTESEFLELMSREKWFTAQEAVDIGLCDEISSAESGGMKLVATAAPIIPMAVAKKIKTMQDDWEREKASYFSACSRFAHLEGKKNDK